MHVMRPKSAKGRTRPKPSEPCTADDSLLHDRRPFSPHPPFYPPRPPPTPSHGFDSSPSPPAFLRHNSPGPAGEPAFNIPVVSLNKFKVLPSIERRSEGDASSEDNKKKTLRSNVIQQSETGATRVLLALRTPCGQRLRCQFGPTDTLRDVVASAEDLSGKRYERVLIETMEVPRRTFTDLNMTLSQCGIVNKSVLCISFKDGA